MCLSCISKQKAAESELTGANGLVCFRVQLKTDSSRPAAAGSETEGVNTAQTFTVKEQQEVQTESVHLCVSLRCFHTASRPETTVKSGKNVSDES